MLIGLGAHPQPNYHLCIHTATPETRLGKARGSPVDPYRSLRLPNPQPAPWNPMSDIAVFFNNALRISRKATCVRLFQ